MSKEAGKINLDGKVAIVTGSSKGIGLAIARLLAEHGAKVVLSSRNQETLDKELELMKQDGLEGMAIACHVAKSEDLKNLVDQTIAKYGRVDVLVNNAATNPVFAKLADSEEAVFDKVMNVNVRACMTLANLCYPHMVSQGSGSIINIASVEGLKPSFGLGIYSISKAALIMLTKSQAKEWGRKGIRSNAICPGLIKTKFSQMLWTNPQMLDKFVNNIPMQRIAQPEEMAGLALYLASDLSSYTTGSIHTADGGYMVAG